MAPPKIQSMGEAEAAAFPGGLKGGSGVGLCRKLTKICCVPATSKPFPRKNKCCIIVGNTGHDVLHVAHRLGGNWVRLGGETRTDWPRPPSHLLNKSTLAH